MPFFAFFYPCFLACFLACFFFYFLGPQVQVSTKRKHTVQARAHDKQLKKLSVHDKKVQEAFRRHTAQVRATAAAKVSTLCGDKGIFLGGGENGNILLTPSPHSTPLTHSLATFGLWRCSTMSCRLSRTGRGRGRWTASRPRSLRSWRSRRSTRRARLS